MATTTEDIFAGLGSQDVADNWSVQANTQEPLIGETLFPAKTQMGREVTWYKGESTATAPLALSGFDQKATIRDRSAMKEYSEKTQLFRQSYRIDEETRQKLITANASGNQGLIDSIQNRIFDDTNNLVNAAKISAELARIQMLTTGKVDLEQNGNKIQVDYQMNPNHIVTADKMWSDDGSKPYDDLQWAMDTINNDSGAVPTRILMNSVTYRALQANSSIKQTILNPTVNTGAINLSNQLLDSYIAGLGLNIQTYDKQFRGYDGQMHKYIADGQVVVMVDGDLGSTRFSTTPEQADLMTAHNTDITMVDNIAISSKITDDPVNKIFKASEMLVPTFEQMDGVYVLNNVASFDANRQKAKLNNSQDSGKSSSDSSSKTPSK